jgi:hypothetical protein
MRQRVFVAILVLLSVASTASAQSEPRSPRVEGIVGHAAFVDESPINHFVFGGAVRFPLSPRVSVGPEAVYMIGPGEDRDLFLTGNVWFDFFRPTGNTLRRVTPYLIAGAGLMRHTDEFFRDFTSNEWAFTGGVGVRIAITDRWYIAPEGRLGWETHSRLTASVGYTFGR